MKNARPGPEFSSQVRKDSPSFDAGSSREGSQLTKTTLLPQDIAEIHLSKVLKRVGLESVNPHWFDHPGFDFAIPQ